MTIEELNDILKKCCPDERFPFKESVDHKMVDGETSDDYLNLAKIDIKSGDDLVKVIRYIAIALFLQRQE